MRAEVLRDKNFGESDEVRGRVTQILGGLTVTPGSRDEDLSEVTDLWIDGVGLRLATRVRRLEEIRGWSWLHQLTIRWVRPSGYPTESDKLDRGHLFFYSMWFNRGFERWVFCEAPALITAARQDLVNRPRELEKNKDSGFHAFFLADLEALGLELWLSRGFRDPLPGCACSWCRT